MLSQHSYVLSDGQKWNTHLLKHYIAPTTWSELVSAMSLPVLGTPRMIHEEPRDAGGQDTEGNRDALMQGTDDAPAAEVQGDGAMHERNHNAGPERWYPD